MHGECASPIEFVVIIMLIKFVKLKILVYLVFFMNVKFLFTTFLESSISIKVIVVLNMLVLHIPFHEYKIQYASTVIASDNAGSMRRCVYEASSGADGEAWPANGGKACGKPDIAF